MAINLVKGQRISLAKDDGSKLKLFCVGANWGAIATKGFFGNEKFKAVDLDLSVILYDGNAVVKDMVYFGNKIAPGILHSGDDLVGDTDGDDGLDNEIISINLTETTSNIEQIFFVLNSYNQVNFGDIPYASIRLFEGTPDKVKSVFATYNVSNQPEFAKKVSMILGKVYRKNGEWKFSAIGDTTNDKTLQEIVKNSLPKYI